MKQKEKTIFKKIIDRELPAHIVYENKNIIAILNKNPVNHGHTLVIPKGNFTDIYDTPDEVLSDMIILSKKIAKAVSEGLNADGINIIINNESAAGQVIFNPHIHIIPRFENDGFMHWEGKTSPSDEKNKILIEKIKAQLKI